MKLSDAEWTVMNAVWDHAPSSARDVLERVATETDWAYTTVKTLLGRLVEKGALVVRMRANTSLYEPRITRESARRSALRSLLEAVRPRVATPGLQFLTGHGALVLRLQALATNTPPLSYVQRGFAIVVALLIACSCLPLAPIQEQDPFTAPGCFQLRFAVLAELARTSAQ